MTQQREISRSAAVGVQLGLIITPMLDMAFQILAFFIMTYHPSALEAHVPGALVPSDRPAIHNPKETNSLPDPPLPEPLLIEELQVAVLVRIKANVQGSGRLDGTPNQVFIKTALQTEETLIADADVAFDVALRRLSARLNEMAKTDHANLRIVADGALRQQYVMQVFDVARKAQFTNVHFVPPPVLNTKLR